MKLRLFKDYTGDKPVLIGEVTEDDTASALYDAFPPVWGSDGKPLVPADGAAYLRAVHEELGRGTFTWTELDEV